MKRRCDLALDGVAEIHVSYWDAVEVEWETVRQWMTSSTQNGNRSPRPRPCHTVGINNTSLSLSLSTQPHRQYAQTTSLFHTHIFIIHISYLSYVFGNHQNRHIISIMCISNAWHAPTTSSSLQANSSFLHTHNKLHCLSWLRQAQCLGYNWLNVVATTRCISASGWAAGCNHRYLFQN